MSGKYDDIINLPHHVSATRPRMPIADRAAQFSPFAALTGHHEAIREVARITVERVELDEQAREILDLRLQRLLENRAARHEVRVTYFSRDSSKDGGAYFTLTGIVDKVHESGPCLALTDGTRIPLADIVDIQSAAFCLAEDIFE